ncbi:MAG: site-2 protease family protein [Mycobacteriales bacterium]
MSEPERRARRPAPWLTTGVTIGRIFGIPIVIAPSWFLFAVLLMIESGPQTHSVFPVVPGAVGYGVGAALLLILYGSVLLHELTHSLVARSLGLPVRRIVLQLLGGVSEITGEPVGPAEEYLVAVAGPMTSLLLAGVGWAVVAATPAHGTEAAIAWGFAWINTVVAVFNLLPGLPLDGGRVLRSVIWWITKDKSVGTRGSAYAGRALALIVLLVALRYTFVKGAAGQFYFFWLLLIAFFMWASAGQSLAQGRLAAALPRISARALARRTLAVTADLPLAEAVRRAHETGARALIIVDSRGLPDGIVSEAEVASIPQERRPWVSTGTVSHRIEDGMRIRADLAGEELLSAMQQRPASEYLLVEAGGAIAGVLAQVDVLAAMRASR